MSLMVAEPETTFIPAPAGLHLAVCVDVIDRGMQKTMYGDKHKIDIVWQIEEKMEDGNLFTARSRFTASLHQKSLLRPALESWRGRPFTADELKGFDLEKLIGANCQLNIVHNTKDGKTYANVATIVPAGKGAAKLVPDGSYTRVKDRPDYVPVGGNGGDVDAAGEDEDDDMPF